MNTANTNAGAPADANAPPNEQLQTTQSPAYGVTTTETKDSTTAETSDQAAAPIDAPVSTDEGSTTASAPQQAVEIDKSQPEDFDGEIATNNELPSVETIKKIENYIVLDRDGKSRTFKSLYSGNNVARRVLVVFIRHFFCGNCQQYLRVLSESITPDALLQLPVSTFIVVVGCGDPALIDMYVEATDCPFPLYTDPTRALFDELGMTKTLALGSKPAYMKKSMWRSTLESIGQGLKVLPKGLALKSGDQRQVGGEFLFEPLDIVTPIMTPNDERQMTVGSTDGADDRPLEEKRVTWCHRMKSTRDHAEIPELMEVLGLDGQGAPIKDLDGWEKALQSRKGKGSTMAPKMNELSELNDAKEA